MSFLQSLVGKVRNLGHLFVFLVVAPTLISILYFGLIATDTYISESQFIVRSPQRQTPTGIGVLLRSTGIGSADDENQAAQSYVLSRDALHELNRAGAVQRAYSGARISLFDRFNPLGFTGTFEDLYSYFLKRVEIDHESSSSITKLTVRAYSPEDAQRLNRRLLELSEGLVNRLNERARSDLIATATREVDDAERRAATAALALSSYRNAQGVVDPEKQASVQLQMISKLQDELIATRTQLAELRTVAPRNPQIAVLEARAAELSDEVDSELGKVAGGQRSLSSVAARYQRLLLDSQFADKQLAAAMASLNEARNDALRKQVYVERIVQPNLPDDAREPRRLRGVLATFILGLVCWGVASMLLAGVREHHG